MAFLPAMFERKSAADARATGHAIAASPSGMTAGQYASGGMWDTDQAVRNAYERVNLVFRCVDAIASNQAPLPMFVRVGDREQNLRSYNPQLNKLLNVRTNKYETAAMFRYRLSSLALLSRRGVFIEIVGDPMNPESLHLIPPGTCEPIPDAKNFVAGYKVRTVGQIEEILRPEQVIWIRTKPHPTDPYAQMTPLVAAGITAETDYYARLFNRNFMMNDGRPGLLITVQGAISAEDAGELKRRFGGGPMAAGQTSVIESDGIEVADLGTNPRDMQWTELARVSKEDIMIAFGVPESVLGNASGRTFDNADAEYEMFWTHTMVGHCDALAAGMDALTGINDDSKVIAFDYSVVDVLQRQQRRKEDKAMTEFLNGLITWNEYREVTGKKPWNTLAARIAVLPSGIAMAENPDDQAGIMKLPNVGQMGAQPPAQQLPGLAAGDTYAQSTSSYMGARQGSLEGSRNFDNLMSARALRLAGKLYQPALEHKADPVITVESWVVENKEHPYEALRTKTEGMLQGVMLGWASRQARVVSDRLDHAKVRKGTRHWKYDDQSKMEAKAFTGLDPYYVVEVDEWVQEMRDDFGKVLRDAMSREAKRVARDMFDNGIIQKLNGSGVGNPGGLTPLDKLVGSRAEKDALVEGVLDKILSIVDQSTRRQSNRIAEKIREMDQNGASLSDIKREVRAMVSDQSSWHKALTTNVVTSAYEGIKNEVYGRGGNFVEKTWNTMSDEKVRMSHKEVDGDTKRAAQPFVVGTTAMMYPGDPLAPIGEVANCRCWLSWSAVGQP